MWTLCKHNGLDILLDGMLQIAANVLKVAPALLTKSVLEAIASPDRNVRLGALKYAVLALLLGISTALLDITHVYYGDRAIWRSRSQLITRKCFLASLMLG
jgi:hypothetical protein